MNPAQRKLTIPNLALRCPVCRRTIKGAIRLRDEHGITVLICACGQAFSILVRFLSEQEVETNRVLREQARNSVKICEE
jgi:hypothetical protein